MLARAIEAILAHRQPCRNALTWPMRTNGHKYARTVNQYHRPPGPSTSGLVLPPRSRYVGTGPR